MRVESRGVSVTILLREERDVHLLSTGLTTVVDVFGNIAGVTKHLTCGCVTAVGSLTKPFLVSCVFGSTQETFTSSRIVAKIFDGTGTRLTAGTEAFIPTIKPVTTSGFGRSGKRSFIQENRSSSTVLVNEV